MALTLAPAASLQDTDSSSVLSQVSQVLVSPAPAQPAATKSCNKTYIDGFLDSPSSFFTEASGQDKNSTTRRASNRVYRRRDSNSYLRSSELGSSASYSSPLSPPSRPKSATVTVSGTRPPPRSSSSTFICPPKSLLQGSNCHLPDTTPVKTPLDPPRASPTPSVSSISLLSYSTTIAYPAMDPPAYSELPPSPVPVEHESDIEETETETETEQAESSALSSSRFNSLSRGAGLRNRIFGSREKLSSITTTPGFRGAGETETEGEGPPVRLPTTRNRPIRISQALGIPDASGSHIYTHWLTPILFETSRLLSIVPATLGFLYHVAHFLDRWPDFGSSPEIGPSRKVCKVDYAVSAIWALLTAYQCLALTSGLLTRWRVYYPPLPTLIRLLALQAICWPLTHITLSIVGHDKRPEAAWAVVGTATCISRSVQLWVTSNLWWDHLAPTAGSNGISSGVGNGSGSKLNEGPGKRSKSHKSYHRWRGGKWGGRRWDWGEVGWQCTVPAGTVYFIMAWAQVLGREWGEC